MYDRITPEQYKLIEHCLPRQRGNVRIHNLQTINAILYVIENGCKWRSLPKAYGNWHTIYVRMNRWSKNGVLKNLFETMQKKNIIRIKMEATPETQPAPRRAAPVEMAAEDEPKFIWSPNLTVRL